MNLDILKLILTTDHEYWVFMERINFRDHKDEDRTIFALIPQDIQRSVIESEILLKDIEKLHRCSLDSNVYLNADYPPFQSGRSMRSIVRGFPVLCNQKAFLKAALMMPPDADYFALKELHDEMNVEEQAV